MSKRCNTVLHVIITLCVLLLMCFSIQSVIADEASEPTSSAISVSEIEMLSELPISFTENVGQAPEEIAFLIQSMGYLFGFTHDGFYFIPSQDPSKTESIDRLPVTKMTIEGAASDVSIQGTELLPGVAHYFIGSDESKWITDVPTYAGIAYDTILPGVSLSYSGIEGVLKREFVLDPGISPESIILAYEGVEALELTEDGTLLVHATYGVMSESAPVSYQMVDGVRVDLLSSFFLLPENKVSFHVDGYDPALPLIIDPYLYYSTMLGGGMNDRALDMALGSSGDVYLTGYTQSSNFPILNPLISLSDPVYNGATFCSTGDVFVTRIGTGSNGNASVIFSTYLGGNGWDEGRGIAIDLFENIYVTGETNSPNFPTLHPIQNGGKLRGNTDAFVTKLTSKGEWLRYSTYIGGTGAEAANAIFVDPSTTIAYITGLTKGNSAIVSASSRYPTTAGAYQTEPSTTNIAQPDAFVSGIVDNGASTTLRYSTYLHGKSLDEGKDLVVDKSGNIYVVGTTSSTDLVPADVPGYQKTLSSSTDAFVFKLNPKETGKKQAVYATYLGGTRNEEGEAITIDADNNVYVTGTTTSTNFPVTPNAYQKTKSYWAQVFDTDIFVSKINTTKTDLVYSTYLGGISNDGVYDITLDSLNQAYIAGYTDSSDYPRLGDSFKDVPSARDAIVTVLNADGSDLVYSTYFGGHGEDVASAVRVSTTGEIYVAGYSNSPTFPQLLCDPRCFNEAFSVVRWVNQTVYGGVYNGGINHGSYDAFVLKFVPATLALFKIDFNTTDPRVGPPRVVNLKKEFIGFGPITEADIVSWLWSSTGGQSGSGSPWSANFAIPGKYSIQLQACTRGNVCQTVQKTSYIIVEDSNANITVAGRPVTDMSVTLLENTSFQMSWTSSTPLPDSIAWEFTAGGNTYGPYISNSLTLNKPDGLPFGLYTVTATPYYGTSPDQINGTPKTRTAYLDILKRPTIKFFNVTADEFQTGPVYVYPNTPVQLQVDYTGVSNVKWDYGDGTTSNGWVTPFNLTSSHTYTAIGEYWPVVTVYNTTTGEISSEKRNEHRVIVYDRVDPKFTCTPNPAMVGEAVTCLDQSTGIPVEWLWDFGNLNFSKLQNPTYAYSTPGNYNISLWATDIAGKVLGLAQPITIINATSDLVTLAWEPSPVSMGRSYLRDIAFILKNPIKGLYTIEFTATIADTNVAAFTAKGTSSSSTSWEGFRVEAVGNPLSPTGVPLYKSVKVYGISYAGFPNSTVPLELGKLEISGIADGVTEITFSSPEIAYRTKPSELYHVKLESAQIMVKSQFYSTLPLPNMKGPQADLNRDGLIDDFNGDGKVNAFDVVVFFDAYVKGYLSPASAYDYNKNGKVDLQDIVVFYEYWSALNALAMMLGDDAYDI